MSCNVNTIERILERMIRIEYGTVVRHDDRGKIGVQNRDDPDGDKWNTVTVRFRNSKTRKEKSGEGYGRERLKEYHKVLHYYCLVLQRYSQKWAGEPYMPRIGDMVAVLFIHNQKPLVLGTVYTDTQDPVCRAPFSIDSEFWDKYDARYDYVNKWCQWKKPSFTINEEVSEHFPGRYPICHKIFHKNRDQIRVTDCIQGDENACEKCTLLDHITRSGNQWEKIYSGTKCGGSCGSGEGKGTDSVDCEHPYIPVCGTELTERRHEWHEPCGSYQVYQNNGSSLDWGKGLIRIGNATCECAQKAHINMNPRGTIDIHTKNEKATAYKDENEGTRMSVVSLDDDTVLHSFQAIDFNKTSFIEIRKDGDIFLSSINGASNMALKGTEHTAYINGLDTIRNSATGDIYETCTNHRISGNNWVGVHCYHTSCDCASDRRLKTNINDLLFGINEIVKMNPVSFNWINRPNENVHYGLIAQDLQSILPNIVINRPDGSLGISYEEIIPVMINAIKELNTKVESLESQLKMESN